MRKLFFVLFFVNQIRRIISIPRLNNVLKLLTPGNDPSAEQLLVFLDRPPETLLFVSALDSVWVLTLAMSAFRTVSMNRLPAPDMVPLPNSEEDDDDEAPADFVDSVPGNPLGPGTPPPTPTPSQPRKSLVLSLSSSHSECNSDVRVLS